MEKYSDPNFEVARTLYNGSSLLRTLGFFRANHERLSPGNEHARFGFLLNQLRSNGFGVAFAPRSYFNKLGKDGRDMATWIGNTLVLDYELASEENSLRAEDEIAHEIGVYLATNHYGSRGNIPMVNLNGPTLHLTHVIDNLHIWNQAA